MELCRDERSVATTLQTLERLLDSAPEGADAPLARRREAWWTILESEIACLHQDLEGHYRAGAASGLYGQLFVADFPQHINHVVRLRGERVAILLALERILDELRWPFACVGIEARVLRAVSRIRDNDRDENELLQQAYTLDLGVAG